MRDLPNAVRTFAYFQASSRHTLAYLNNNQRCRRGREVTRKGEGRGREGAKRRKERWARGYLLDIAARTKRSWLKLYMIDLNPSFSFPIKLWTGTLTFSKVISWWRHQPHNYLGIYVFGIRKDTSRVGAQPTLRLHSSRGDSGAILFYQQQRNPSHSLSSCAHGSCVVVCFDSWCDELLFSA